jgi:transposase InsO family protein
MAKEKNPFQMAQFKFGMIAPIVQGTFSERSAAAYYKRVTGEPILRPDGSMYLYKPGTLHNWELLYRKGGMDALIVGPRKDKGNSRALSADSIQRIYQILDQFPKLPATQIRQKLLDEGIITSKVSERCVQRFVKTWGLKNPRSAGSKERRAFEEEYFGALWQADSCYFPFIPDKKEKRRTYLQVIIDDHSRMIVAAELFFNDNSLNLQKLVKGAISAYGIPNKLYVDNGSPYINNQTAFVCANVGAVLIHAASRDSSAKGKVERVFRTIKEKWLYGIDISEIKSIEQFNQMLTVFIREYNLTTHSSTGETPMDRYLKTRDKIKTPLNREWLDERFLNRERRKVRNDGTIQVRKVLFDVPLQFTGQVVDVRFPPDRPEEAYIASGDRKYPLRVTNKAENARSRRLPVIDFSFGGIKNV